MPVHETAPNRPEASAEIHHLSGQPAATATQPLPAEPNNPGTVLDRDLVDTVKVNLSAVERRTGTLTTRRTVKKDWQAAWLLKAMTCIDLTTLNGDDTAGRVRRLCAKARAPLRPDH